MHWSDAVAEAAWIGPRLAPFASGFVTSVVPGAFAAYARVLHPLPTSHGTSASWAEVAAWSGLPLQRDSAFVDVALPEQPPAAALPWDGGPPAEGTLESAQLDALIELLGPHGQAPYWFGIWDGFGWDNATALTAWPDPDAVPALAPTPSAHARQTTAPPDPVDPVPTDVRSGPRVRLPNRDYLLYTGNLDDAAAFLPDQNQSANLWWPGDHSWCVATEIDLPWTYVGGSVALVDAVLADPRVEAQQVQPTDSHWRRPPGWVVALADAMADELLQYGRTSTRTAVGTVAARLDRAALGRRHLTVTSAGAAGDRSWSTESTTSRRGSGLRAEAVELLTQAVLEPVA